MISQLRNPGIHEKKIKRYFGKLTVPPETGSFEDNVAVMAFINRSGSSVVSEYLRATGAFSGFGEPLNQELVIERAKKFGITSFAAYLDWLMANIHRPGTQFGMKASWDQIVMLLRSGAIPRYFSNIRWIFVQRRDVLAQAISFSIATQTRQWHSFQERESGARQPEYDFEDIRHRVESIANNYTAIQCLLSLNGLVPYYLVYEDFLVDPISETRKLAAFLGAEDVSVNPSRLRMEKQGNEVNEQFRLRFIEDFARWQRREP